MNWSGAALIDAKGELIGVGSLIVPTRRSRARNRRATMFRADHLLKPILADLIARGRASGPVRPWLGMTTEELRGRVFVTRVSPEGPRRPRGRTRWRTSSSASAARTSRRSLSFYRKVWSRGAAGTEIALRILQGTQGDGAQTALDRPAGILPGAAKLTKNGRRIARRSNMTMSFRVNDPARTERAPADCPQRRARGGVRRSLGVPYVFLPSLRDMPFWAAGNAFGYTCRRRGSSRSSRLIG